LLLIGNDNASKLGFIRFMIARIRDVKGVVIVDRNGAFIGERDKPHSFAGIAKQVFVCDVAKPKRLSEGEYVKTLKEVALNKSEAKCAVLICDVSNKLEAVEVLRAKRRGIIVIATVTHRRITDLQSLACHKDFNFLIGTGTGTNGGGDSDTLNSTGFFLPVFCPEIHPYIIIFNFSGHLSGHLQGAQFMVKIALVS
jgi:hypothetical protein